MVGDDDAAELREAGNAGAAAPLRRALPAHTARLPVHYEICTAMRPPCVRPEGMVCCGGTWRGGAPCKRCGARDGSGGAPSVTVPAAARRSLRASAAASRASTSCRALDQGPSLHACSHTAWLVPCNERARAILHRECCVIGSDRQDGRASRGLSDGAGGAAGWVQVRRAHLLAAYVHVALGATVLVVIIVRFEVRKVSSPPAR